MNKLFGKPVFSFTLRVPHGYRHDSKISSYRDRNKKENGDPFLKNILYDDSHFPKTSDQLIPGAIYEVNVVQIKETVSCQDCVDYIRGNNYLLVGLQGLILAVEQQPDNLAEIAYICSSNYLAPAKYLVALDGIKSLPTNSSNQHILPLCTFIGRDCPGFLTHAYFEEDLHKNLFVLLVQKI